MAVGAASRSFEYDEAYTHFYLAGLPLPEWPIEPRTVGALRDWIEGRSSSFMQIAEDLMRHETHPPLYFWVMVVWRWLFGPGHFTARVFSVLCAGGSMLVMWRLATVARVPALPSVACTFLAYAVFYPATLARAYSLALLLVLLGALALAVLLRDPERGRRRPLNGAGLALGAGLAFGLAGLSHYLALLAAAAIGGAFALSSLARRRVLPVLAIGLGVLPPLLAVLSIRAQQGSADWFHPDFDFGRDIWRMLEMQAAALFARTPLLLDEPWSLLAAVLIAPCSLLIAGTVLGAARPIVADPVRRMLLVGAAAMPLGLLLLGVFTDRAPFVSRYASYSVPFCALVFAAGLGRLGERRPRLAAAVLGYVLLWQAVGAGSQVLWPATQQEFRPIVAEVARRWVPGESVLAMPVGYDHLGKNGPFLWEAPPDWPMVVVDAPTERAVARLGPVRRLFLVTFVEQSGENVLGELRPALRDAGWRLVETGEYLEVWSR
jgi:4-amino-4-deoxy-L-arabinose transferase-like glycosyltransferase